MVGAIGSAASGLALAGPQMLKWIKWDEAGNGRTEVIQHCHEP